nr:hypothetical protein [Mycolicibacterium xanthum]
MTSSSVRWVLVEGTDGEGDTLERGSLPIDPDRGFDADALLGVLLDDAGSRRLHAVGLNWTVSAEAGVSAMWQALTDRGVENVIAVSDIEAAEALARGIAALSGFDRVVLCVAEPSTSVIAAVTPDGVTADRVHPEALGKIESYSPEAVFVVGSGQLEGVVSALRERTDAEVVSAEEAELALARGAALASASAIAILDAEAAPAGRTLSPTATLASVLAAAVVTFVVSLSIALGMTLTPDSETPRMANAVNVPLPDAAPPSPVEAAPRAAPAAPPAAPGAPPALPAEPVAVAVPEARQLVEPPAAGPPLPEAPAYQEPGAPAYVPPGPAPVYVPPAASAPVPNTVPPQVNTPQPRLRDRIIERIPIINRFHEPQYEYTP